MRFGRPNAPASRSRFSAWIAVRVRPLVADEHVALRAVARRDRAGRPGRRAERLVAQHVAAVRARRRLCGTCAWIGDDTTARSMRGRRRRTPPSCRRPGRPSLHLGPGGDDRACGSTTPASSAWPRGPGPRTCEIVEAVPADGDHQHADRRDRRARLAPPGSSSSRSVSRPCADVEIDRQPSSARTARSSSGTSHAERGDVHVGRARPGRLEQPDDEGAASSGTSAPASARRRPRASPRAPRPGRRPTGRRPAPSAARA